MSSDQFKAVGIATVKGIGRGSKALGKAGYKTYKKNEAKRQGKEYVEPASDNDGKSTTTGTEKGSMNHMFLDHCQVRKHFNRINLHQGEMLGLIDHPKVNM